MATLTRARFRRTLISCAASTRPRCTHLAGWSATASHAVGDRKGAVGAVAADASALRAALAAALAGVLVRNIAWEADEQALVDKLAAAFGPVAGISLATAFLSLVTRSRTVSLGFRLMAFSSPLVTVWPPVRGWMTRSSNLSLSFSSEMRISSNSSGTAVFSPLSLFLRKLILFLILSLPLSQTSDT